MYGQAAILCGLALWGTFACIFLWGSLPSVQGIFRISSRVHSEIVRALSASSTNRVASSAPIYWENVEATALSFANDSHTSTLLALLVDLTLRHSYALDVLSAGGAGAGQYLTTSSVLLTNVAAAISRSGRDCRRRDTLITTCLLTSGESAFLQEWFAWHILQGWAHVFVMIDMRDEDPRWKEVLQVLSPFIGAGYATVVRSGRKDGASPQYILLNACLKAVQTTGCSIRHPLFDDAPVAQVVPRDHSLLPTTDDVTFGRPVCPSERAADTAWRQRVWLSATDDDEFVLLRDGTCITDFLPRYKSHGSLNAQWMFYGGHSHVVHPRNALVVETYAYRMNTVHAVEKFIAHLPQIETLVLGHWVTLVADTNASSQSAAGVNELFVHGPRINKSKPPIDAAWPNLVVAHFYSRSVERTLLKWTRGRPGLPLKNSRTVMRTPTEVLSVAMNWPLPGHYISDTGISREWLRNYNVYDPLLPALASSVRAVLGLSQRVTK